MRSKVSLGKPLILILKSTPFAPKKSGLGKHVVTRKGDGVIKWH